MRRRSCWANEAAPGCARWCGARSYAMSCTAHATSTSMWCDGRRSVNLRRLGTDALLAGGPGRQHIGGHWRHRKRQPRPQYLQPVRHRRGGAGQSTRFVAGRPGIRPRISGPSTGCSHRHCISSSSTSPASTWSPFSRSACGDQRHYQPAARRSPPPCGRALRGQRETQALARRVSGGHMSSPDIASVYPLALWRLNDSHSGWLAAVCSLKGGQRCTSGGELRQRTPRGQ